MFIFSFSNGTIAYFSLSSVASLFYTHVLLLLPFTSWFPTCSLMSLEWLTKLFQVAHKLPVSSLLLPSEAKWVTNEAFSCFLATPRANAHLFHSFSPTVK
jgi:hypothetical protein